MAKYKKKKNKKTASQTVSSSYVRTAVSASIKSDKPLQSRSQIYSDQVFTQITEFINNDSDQDVRKRYKSLCKRSGGLLRTVGLIQFLVFLSAKATKGSEVHHQHLLDQLVNELKALKVLPAIQNSNDLTETVRKQNLPEYMYTTKQVLLLLQWHKRLADVLITQE